MGQVAEIQMTLIAMLEAAKADARCLHWLGWALCVMAECWNRVPGLWNGMLDIVVPRIGAWPSLA